MANRKHHTIRDQRLSAFHYEAGQSIEHLTSNASFLTLQAPPTIEPSILKNSLKLV